MRVNRENSFHFKCIVFKEYRYKQVKIFIKPVKIQIVKKKNAWGWRE